MQHDRLAGLPHGLKDGLLVQRDQRPKVHHLQLCTFLGQQVGRLQGQVDHGSIGDDGNVSADAFDLGFSNRNDVVLGRQHGLQPTVQEFVFEIDDRVVVPDRSLQQTLRIIGGRRCDQLEPGRVKEPALRALRMERPPMHPTPERSPNHHRHRGAPAVMVLGCHLGDLIERAGDEIGKLHLHDRPHPHHGRPDGGSDNPRLGERGIQHSPLAVLLLKALRNPEGSAVWPDVFAQEEDGVVSAHLLVQGFGYRLEVSDFVRRRGRRHGFTSSSLANTPSKASGPSGMGLCSANSTPASISFLTRSSTSWRVPASA